MCLYLCTSCVFSVFNNNNNHNNHNHNNNNTVNLGGGNFRGFLIQARSSVSGTPLGKFSVGGDGSQQLSQCSPPEVRTTNEYRESIHD